MNSLYFLHKFNRSKKFFSNSSLKRGSKISNVKVAISLPNYLEQLEGRLVSAQSEIKVEIRNYINIQFDAMIKSNLDFRRVTDIKHDAMMKSNDLQFTALTKSIDSKYDAMMKSNNLQFAAMMKSNEDLRKVYDSKMDSISAGLLAQFVIIITAGFSLYQLFLNSSTDVLKMPAGERENTN